MKNLINVLFFMFFSLHLSIASSDFWLSTIIEVPEAIEHFEERLRAYNQELSVIAETKQKLLQDKKSFYPQLRDLHEHQQRIEDAKRTLIESKNRAELQWAKDTFNKQYPCSLWMLRMKKDREKSINEKTRSFRQDLNWDSTNACPEQKAIWKEKCRTRALRRFRQLFGKYKK